MRWLIVNADDFGLSVGVNKGIIRAYRRGIVTSTTMLVNMPAWAHARDLALATPGLAVGLHFNLVSGDPLSPPGQVASLVNSRGEFAGDIDLLAQANPSHVARELAAQLGRLQAAGIHVTHIDSHHQVHSLPNILPVVLQIASRCGLAVRRVAGQQRHFSRAKALTTGVLLEQFRDQGANRLNLHRLLTSTKARTVEIRCHPGLMDRDLERRSGYTWPRERELAVICSFEREQFAQIYGYKLVNFSHIRNCRR